MLKRVLAILLLTFSLIQFWLPGYAWSQQGFKDSELIPSTAIFAAFANPKAMFEDPTLDLLPRELATAWGKREIGVDPCQLNSVMLLVEAPEGRQPPGFSCTLRFTTPQKLKDSLLKDLQRSELRGRPLYDSENPFEPSIYFPNSKTIVVGTKPFIEKMLDAKASQSGLIDLVQQFADEADHINAFLNVVPLRDLINSELPAA